MSHSLSLLFYIKKSKADGQSKANIYLRTTLDGRRAEFSVGRKVNIKEWNSRIQLVKRNSIQTQEINKELGLVKNKIYTIQ